MSTPARRQQTGAAVPAREVARETARETARGSLLLQRKCACGKAASPLTGECDECRQRRLQGKSLQRQLTVGAAHDPLEREADRVADAVMSPSAAPDAGRGPVRVQRASTHSPSTRMAVPPSVDRTLAGAGAALEPRVRADMEHRFGHDFSRVRVHADAAAHTSARDVEARAYTVGNHVVFGAGQYNPGTTDGRRLLAHELTHVVQQGSARVVQREPEAKDPFVEFTRKQRLETLELLVERLFQDTIALKATIRPMSGPQDDAARNTLKRNRLQMIDLLTERMQLLTAMLDSRTVCDTESAALERDVTVTAQRLFPLTRWKKRMDIELLSEQIADLDGRLAAVNECNSETARWSTERDALRARKRSLARELMSTTVEFKQFDKRWGEQRYGNDAACTTIAEAACGPTSLAMLLNFYELENPEGLAITGATELVLPSETAQYAKDHGRVCNSGTNGETMMKDLSGHWEHYRGRTLQLDDVTTELHNGNPVIFLCKDCKGKNAAGAVQTYEGHFMVLTGVNEAGDLFNVLDSGRNEARNIETIDLTNLRTKTGGFWSVARTE